MANLSREQEKAIFAKIKGKGNKILATPIEIPTRTGMAWFTKANALKLEKEVKPHVGEPMILFGGGGSDQDLVTLKGVSAMPTIKYHYPNDPSYGKLPKDANIVKKEGNHIEYTTPNDYIVEVNLEKEPEKFSGMWSTGKFDPHLGSWKLAKLEKI